MSLALSTSPQSRPGDELIPLFDALFVESERTRLVRGAGEPVYLPASDEGALAEVRFAHGFFASALHEIAHWCIAGAARRRLVDFGYWYKPDGRTLAEQRTFEAVEVKPQALEWIFSVAAGAPFHFSADNLSGGVAEATEASTAFQEAVSRQARTYVTAGLPPRAARFAEALAARYATGEAWREASRYELTSCG